MKFKKYIYLLGISGLALTSCEKWIGPEVNQDKDAPSEVFNNMRLPALQASTAFNVYGTAITAVNTSIFCQYFDGTNRQAQDASFYRTLTSEVENTWTSMYTSAGKNAYDLIAKADAEGSHHFAGTARVMMVLNILATTDIWGDIPFSQAFQGDPGAGQNLTPGYDTQEEIYNSLDKMLDDAIANFAQTPESEALSGDLVYDNDVAMWTKAAYAIKMRMAIHKSKVDAASAYADALAALPNAFTSNGDNMQFNYEENPTKANPMYQYYTNWGPDFQIGKFFFDKLVDTDPGAADVPDPRLNRFIQPNYSVSTPEWTGSHPDSPNPNAAIMGPYYMSMSAPIYFITYPEIKFIEAEAKFGTDKAGAAQAYNEAVLASVEMAGATDMITAEWTALHASADENSITMQMIVDQKYIAMYGQLEAFNDLRRTDNMIGLDLFNYNGDVNNTQFPRRYPYPLNEANYNAGNYKLVSQFDKVWWDQ